MPSLSFINITSGTNIVTAITSRLNYIYVIHFNEVDKLTGPTRLPEFTRDDLWLDSRSLSVHCRPFLGWCSRDNELQSTNYELL